MFTMSYVYYLSNIGGCQRTGTTISAYQRRKCQILEEKIKTTGKEVISNLMKSFQGMDRKQKVFCAMFDGLCENEFTLCITNWNDYGMKIVLEDDLFSFIWAAENYAFLDHWRMLAGVCGLKEKHAKEKERTPWKKRQVFF